MLALTRRKALLHLAMETPVPTVRVMCTSMDMLQQVILVVAQMTTPHYRTAKTLVVRYLTWSSQIPIIRYPVKETRFSERSVIRGFSPAIRVSMASVMD